ncbi:MAG: hypothetical protein ACE15C_10745 [Phycisphaerae bacterium]
MTRLSRQTEMDMKRGGLTLVESAISLVIVAVVVVVFLSFFGSLARGQQLISWRYPATCLASQLMAEVLANPYCEPSGADVFGPESGESNGTRANFDDVDDYDGWTETPPKLKDGAAIGGYAGWMRGVAVQYIDPGTMAITGSDLGVKRITVTVTDPQGHSTAITALRSSSGTYDQKPASATTCVRWIGVELQVGPDSTSRVHTGANVLGIVPG